MQDWAATSVTMEELLSEVQILRRVPHEHIVRLYGLALEVHPRTDDDDTASATGSSSMTRQGSASTQSQRSRSETVASGATAGTQHTVEEDLRDAVDLRAVHIVMELCTFSLDDYMRRSAHQPALLLPQQQSAALSHGTGWNSRVPLDARQRARILQQVASAVAFMHSKNITHRDLKTGNILLKGQGPAEFSVRICDFGLSKVNAGVRLRACVRVFACVCTCVRQRARGVAATAGLRQSTGRTASTGR